MRPPRNRPSRRTQAQQETTTTTIVVAVLAAAMASLLGVLMARRIANPLQQLEATAAASGIRLGGERRADRWQDVVLARRSLS